MNFQNNHSLKVQASEKELMALFPEVANSTPHNPNFRSNIPKIDLQLNDKTIGKNPPASGIRIFEEHNLPLNKTRQSSKSNI